MIKEDYCSLEVTKLLEEKGMNKSNFTHYVQKNNNDGTSEAVSVCTHQMAMKFLREEYNIFIDIRRSLNTYLYGSIIRKDPSDTFSKISERFDSYEEATEVALKYCLTELVKGGKE